MALEPGDKAPAFTLPDQAGNLVKLSSFKGRKVFIYFYPRASTPGCTTQACAINDRLADFGDTVILGVSPDKPSANARFAERYDLGFPLLSDEDHTVTEAWGAWGEKSMYGRKYMGVIRSAFLVDEKGRIERTWYKVKPQDTPVKLHSALVGS